jgi:DNA helicase-2/ATP-dependent DNA helicase PcrA
VHLEVSFARSRNPGGRASRKRTRFLDGLWPDEPRGRVAGTGARRPRGQARQQLTGEGDAALFDALREWRLSVARETDKPAYTILGDATLAEIAEVRPSSIAQLARINGIGPAKIDRYGATLLALVADAGRG